MTTKFPFSKNSRADGLPRSWDFSIQKGYENVTGLIDIAEELLEIPVEPLPDPLVPGNEPWHVSMNINGHDFVDTWEQYLDVLSEYGTICRSGFNHIRLPEDEQPAPPRPQCAVTIDVKLQEKDLETELYFLATIYATGRVECLVMDEEPIGRFQT